MKPGVGVRELAAAEGVSPPAMTAYVDRLKSAGLVSRLRSDRDRRRVELALTDEGARVLLVRTEPPHRLAGGAAAAPGAGGARSRRSCSAGAQEADRGRLVTAAFLRANRRTWSSLRKHRNYRIFFSGQVVSVTGTWMQNIAAAWLILELTHSPVAVGLLMLCQFLPATVLGLFSGVLVDRLDVRRTVIATQAASMVFAAALAAVTLGGIVEPWMVYLLTGLRGISLVVDHPARQAFTFQLVGRDELPNAVALNSGLFNGTRVLGPALGGAMIAVAGPGACFLLNAISFVAVLAKLGRPSGRPVPLDRGDERPTFVGGSREAFAFVRRVPLASVILGTVLLVTTLAFNFNVLLPVLAKQTLLSGPEVFGIVTACFGAAPSRSARLGDGLAREPEAPGRRSRGLRARRATARPAVLAGRRRPAPGRRRLRVHALDVERERLAPARHPGPAARADDGLLLLRLQRGRAGRRAARRLAGGDRRDRARVHGRRARLPGRRGRRIPRSLAGAGTLRPVTEPGTVSA